MAKTCTSCGAVVKFFKNGGFSADKKGFLSDLRVDGNIICCECYANYMKEKYGIREQNAQKEGGNTRTGERNEGRESRMSSKTGLYIGIILCVIGIALGVWAVIRVTSSTGEMVSWASSFGARGAVSEYKTITFTAAAGAITCLVVGLIMVSRGFSVGTQRATGVQPQQTTANEPERREETPASGATVPEQIEQLAKLKEQGILSEAEFEEKKKELLSRM